MWELDYNGWALKNWCFWTEVLEKTSESSLDYSQSQSNQSIPKEISPEYSLEGLMLKLKLQYFCHLMGRTDSFEKTLMLGKIEGRRRRGQQRMRWLGGITETQWTWVWVNARSWWWTRRPGVLQSMGSQKVRHDWATELNWIFSWAINTVLSPDAGRDWRWEEKGTTEDEMVGWHHWLDGHEFEQAPGVGDEQTSLAWCRVTKSHTRLPTELNWLMLLRWLSGKESACQCSWHGFNPWIRKIPWRRKW